MKQQEAAMDKRRVVVVEDHPLMRETIFEALQKVPEVVVTGTASSGEDALALAAIGDADLVIIDVSLPKMSGIELVRELRRRRPQILCAMLSGHMERSYIKASLDAGARGYVAKGSAALLVKAVRRVLAGEIFVSDGVGARPIE